MTTRDAPLMCVFAGGGSGGHIYPGLAIAEALESLEPACRSVFLVSDRAIDERVLEGRATRVSIARQTPGKPIEHLPPQLDNAGLDGRRAWAPLGAKPLGRSPRRLAAFFGAWGGSVRDTRRVLRTARASGQRVVLAAMGGFVAAPAVVAARAERTRVALVNLDAAPGLANRFIAGRSTRVLTAAEGPGVRDAWTRVGPIVRADAVAPGDAHACRQSLRLDPDRPVLMVTGGSQGAESIDALLIAILQDAACRRALEGWQVLHQAGPARVEDVRQAYEAAGVCAQVVAHAASIGRWWGAAELSIWRAGAGSVAEAWRNAAPAVFLPYPHHRDQHQRLNAARLVDAHAAIVLDDHVDVQQNLAAHRGALIGLLGSAERRASMRRAYAALGEPDGARAVAIALSELAQSPAGRS